MKCLAYLLMEQVFGAAGTYSVHIRQSNCWKIHIILALTSISAHTHALHSTCTVFSECLWKRWKVYILLGRFTFHRLDLNHKIGLSWRFVKFSKEWSKISCGCFKTDFFFWIIWQSFPRNSKFYSKCPVFDSMLMEIEFFVNGFCS